MPAPSRFHRSSTRQSTCGNLPYDPEEWEQRLVAARAQREKVLQRRSEGRQRTSFLPDSEAPDQSLTTLFPGVQNDPRDPPRKVHPEGHRVVDEGLLILGGSGAARMRADAPPVQRGPEQPQAREPKRDSRVQALETAGANPPEPRWTSLREPSDGVAAADPSSVRMGHEVKTPRRPAGRVRPALFGLVIGCVAGASFATFGGIGQSMSELRSRVAPLVPFAAVPPPDVTAGVAPSLAPLPDAGVAPPAPEPVLLPEATEAAAAFVAPAGPPAPAAVPANLPVEIGGTDSRPAFSSTPVAPDAPSPALARPSEAFEIAHREEEPALPDAPPTLAVPGASAGAAEGAAALSFRPQASRIVVQAPQNMPPPRREDALSRLVENDWSAEEAVRSPFTISETHVRYYHAQDRRAAEELAALFDAAARDFTSYAPSPDEGLLELWLSGKGAPPVIRQARSRPTPSRAAANRAPPTPSAPRETNLFDRIVNALEGNSGGNARGTRRDGSDGASSVSARGGSGSGSRSASSDDGRSSAGDRSRGDDGRGASDRSGSGGEAGSSSGGGGSSSSGGGGSSSSGGGSSSGGSSGSSSSSGGSSGSSSSGGASSSGGGESSSGGGGGSSSGGGGGSSGASNGNASGGGGGGASGGNGGGRGNSGDHGRGADNAGGNGNGGGNNGRGGGNGGGKGGNNGRGNGR